MLESHVGLLVLKLSGISGAFSALYDSVAQAAESCCGRQKLPESGGGGKAPPCGEEAAADPTPEPPGSPSGAADEEEEPDERCVCRCGRCRYDLCRTARYSAVHMLWNGPYHVPKLLCLNWLFPGGPSVAIAVKKTLVADLFFSPIEALGVLVLLQAWRDGSCSNVPTKLQRDYPMYMLTKWAGHIPAHFVTFMTTQSVVGMFVSNFLYKSGFEVLLAVIAARQPPHPAPPPGGPAAECHPLRHPGGAAADTAEDGGEPEPRAP
eukprot:TRINITY_DN55212_c0_g1_i1.p1 TRINITY_DN55212_c0_g1~~TRINITY_DN55212_c0_g1_i1.p1  ORF type:complete len:264 (+),score=76.62 TRINITY_DN55212_c0_g1_i1:98-889(+)